MASRAVQTTVGDDIIDQDRIEVGVVKTIGWGVTASCSLQPLAVGAVLCRKKEKCERTKLNLCPPPCIMQLQARTYSTLAGHGRHRRHRRWHMQAKLAVASLALYAHCSRACTPHQPATRQIRGRPLQSPYADIPCSPVGSATIAIAPATTGALSPSLSFSLILRRASKHKKRGTVMYHGAGIERRLTGRPFRK